MVKEFFKGMLIGIIVVILVCLAILPIINHLNKEPIKVEEVKKEIIKPEVKKEPDKRIKLIENTIVDGYNIYIISVDGVEYLYPYHGGIIKLEKVEE